MNIQIRIIEPKECWAPGDTLAVEVEWHTSESTEEIEVRLLWRTAGRGDEETGVAATRTIRHPGTQSHDRLEFELPAAPWSFVGELLTVGWLVDATLWPSGEHAEADFVLSPTGSALTPLVDATEDLLAQIENPKVKSFVGRLLERVAKAAPNRRQPRG